MFTFLQISQFNYKAHPRDQCYYSNKPLDSLRSRWVMSPPEKRNFKALLPSSRRFYYQKIIQTKKCAFMPYLIYILAQVPSLLVNE